MKNMIGITIFIWALATFFGQALGGATPATVHVIKASSGLPDETVAWQGKARALATNSPSPKDWEEIARMAAPNSSLAQTAQQEISNENEGAGK